MSKIKNALITKYIIFMIILVISLLALLVSLRSYLQIDELKRNSKIIIIENDGTLKTSQHI